jgi:serine/threonine protein kinase/Tfp pilus assembly protein PilF
VKDIRTLSAGLEALVADLADEFMDRLRRGERPDPGEYARRHPEHAAVITQVLLALPLLGLSSPGEPPPLAPPAPAGSETGCLGDYRLVREVGRGGMGVVYEAEQISLGRRVALKVLPFAGALDPLHLQRFKNEAQAAAHLHHPNIVPVFAVGCERGAHYYAMQFIEGPTLADLIAELRRRAGLDDPDAEPAGAPARSGDRAPTPDRVTTRSADHAPTFPERLAKADTFAPAQASWLTEQSAGGPGYFRRVAGMGVQAAEALEHAHQMGILHRDVKPANLLLDERGNIWITDFGLAQFQSAAPQLTRTGCVLGTLRYMSPEQALARHGLVDHRTDVYALGMTLYELATLRPAFRGRERHELLREITTDDPRAPRALNPSVPAELETILLKALEKNPAERYATAQELADDLKRFLDDRPIQARPPTLRQKAAKWLRRHTVVVRAALVVLTLTVVGLAAGSVVLWQEHAQTLAALNQVRAQETKTQDALQEARGKQALASEALTRAEESAHLANEALKEARDKHATARQVVDRMWTDVAEEWLKKEPGLEPLQETFLREALAFYVKETEQQPNDPQVAAKTAQAYLRVADIQQHFGQVKEAEDSYHHAISLLVELAPEHGQKAENRKDLADCHMHLSNMLYHSGRRKDAQGELRTALDIQEELIAAFPGESRYRQALARGYSNWATFQLESGHRREAEEAAARAVGQAELLVGKPVEYWEDLETLATVLNNQGAVFYNAGRLADAEKAWGRALEVGQKMERAAPERRETWDLMATSHDYLGALFLMSGRVRESEPLWWRALEYRERLCDAYPHTVKYRQELAYVGSRLAHVLKDLGKPDEAEKHYRQAVKLGEQLARDFPALTSYQAQRAKTYNDLGHLLQERGKLCEAEGNYRRAVDLLEQQDEENSPSYLDDLSIFQNNLGEVCRMTGRPQEAEQPLRTALAARLELVRRSPARLAPPEVVPGITANLAILLAQTDRADEAEQTYHRTLDVLEEVSRDNPALKTYLTQRAQTHNWLGHLLVNRGRVCEAEENYRRAVNLLEQEGAEKDRTAGYLHDLSVCWANVADVCWKTGRPQETEQALRAALAARLELVRRYPGTPDPQGVLRLIATNLGNLLDNTGRTEEGEEILRKYAAPRP